MPSILRLAGFAITLVILAMNPAKADDAVDCSKGAIPAGPLAGTLSGAAFTLASVTLDPNNKRTQNGVTFDDYHIYLTATGGAVLDLTAITVTGKLPDGKVK